MFGELPSSWGILPSRREPFLKDMLEFSDWFLERSMMRGLERWLGRLVVGKTCSGVSGGSSVKTVFEIESGRVLGDIDIAVW